MEVKNSGEMRGIMKAWGEMRGWGFKCSDFEKGSSQVGSGIPHQSRDGSPTTVRRSCDDPSFVPSHVP